MLALQRAFRTIHTTVDAPQVTSFALRAPKYVSLFPANLRLIFHLISILVQCACYIDPFSGFDFWFFVCDFKMVIWIRTVRSIYFFMIIKWWFVSELLLLLSKYVSLFPTNLRWIFHLISILVQCARYIDPFSGFDFWFSVCDFKMVIWIRTARYISFFMIIKWWFESELLLLNYLERSIMLRKWKWKW